MKSKSYFLSVLFILSACNIQTADTVQERGIVPLLSNDTSTIQHYQALVIGNNQYDYSPLQNPVNDATDMARVLSEMGFEVTLKTNVKQKAMDKAINTFGRHLSENKGVGLFYFAGHGARVSGENYLLPINNNSIQTEDDLKYHAVAARKILKKMEDATLNIMILDACRNNPYQGTTRSLQQGLSRLDHANNSSGSIIAFATAPETQAFDSSLNGRNGLYTSHILKSLKNAYETHQRIDDMFMGVRNAVELESSGKQIPWYSASLRTPFCFGGCQNSVSSEQAQLETFAHRMGINIKEIATDQMPAWLNDDNSDIMGYGVVTNSRILEDRVLSWEESVLRSITLALGVITRQLKVNLDGMF
ncbi:MAG: caspase family protein, partial [Thiomargarita sp.]|nr:caspase family protein [Thiomargarita sp.]